MGEEKDYSKLNELLKEDGSFKIIRFDDFFKGAKEDKEMKGLAERVTEEINKENRLFDKSAYEYGRTWSILGHQVVGAETE